MNLNKNMIREKLMDYIDHQIWKSSIYSWINFHINKLYTIA